MIALIQRVSRAEISIDDKTTAKIKQGVVALVAVEKSDSRQTADKLLKRLLAYRLFADKDDKMNLSLQDISGELLLVPQFTLAADTSKGLRPSFAAAAAPGEGKLLFDYLLAQAQTQHPKTRSGTFGAAMQVSLTNDGPVTFWLQTK